MKIRIPRRAVTAFTAFVDWGDVPLASRGRFVFRRIDAVIIVAGVLCTAYYGFSGGWYGAAVGLLAFSFVALVASWLL